MKKWILEKVRPFFGNWGRKYLPGLYKVYEKMFWKIVIKRRNKGLHQKGYLYLEKIDAALKKYGVDYFLTYGTLLGIIREGEFIPYDDDIDLGVIKNEKFSWEKLEKAMSEIGMEKKIQFRLNGELTEQTYREGNLSVDFFLYEEKEGKSVSYVYYQEEGREYEKDDFSVSQNITSLIDQTKMIEKKGRTFSVPEHPELFLKEIYGPDWRVPIAGWSKERDVVKGGKGRRERIV